MTDQATRRRLARRRFVIGIACPIAVSFFNLSSRQAEAAVRERTISLRHSHTGESLKTVYFADGRYLPEALRAATHHLRDWRDNTTLPVDPKLLDLLWWLRSKLELAEPIQIYCGYRSPHTNAMLRRTRHGVARNSLHMRSMAADIHVDSRSLRTVRQAAMSLGAGGVGYYPRSGFVH